MWRRRAVIPVALVYTKYRLETGLDWVGARLRDKYFAGNEISPHYLYPVCVCCVIIPGRNKNRQRYICVGHSHQKSGETSLEVIWQSRDREILSLSSICFHFLDGVFLIWSVFSNDQMLLPDSVLILMSLIPRPINLL